MTLTRGDDYPLHQTPEPIAYSGTDRNFYDRYFFNGYAAEGDRMFAVALGVYPHLNVIDAHFSVIRDGVQVCLHASACLNMERMNIAAGPISIEIQEPLQKLRVIVDDAQNSIKADIEFVGRSFPIEEPRFMRRIGPRAFMDYTRLTQNGHYTGWIEVDGKRERVDGFSGTRDRSWGVRPVGSRDPQEMMPPAPMQFYWLWSPTSFEDGSFFFHTNDDDHGRPWNTRAVWASDQSNAEQHAHFEAAKAKVEWRSGTRHATRAVIDLVDEDGGKGSVTFEPEHQFYMRGIGYTHPTWGHGISHGMLEVEREDIILKDVDVQQMHNLHIQAVSKVTYVDAHGRTRVGRGVLEQLVMGAYEPAGFTGVTDFAK